MVEPSVRHEAEYVPLTKQQFRDRFFARFYDPAFDAASVELEKIFELAWDGYIKYRKTPRTRPAGEGFADPAFDLPLEWLYARSRIQAAEQHQKDPQSPSRILVVNGSTRSEHTCPGEISKTRRLARCAQEVIEGLPGYYKPYATSHEDLDADPDVFVTVQNAALSLANMVAQIRSGQYRAPNAGLHSPREK